MSMIDYKNPLKYATYLNPSLQAQTQQLLSRCEMIQQALYDYQAYAAAGGTSFTFFQQPAGQSSKTLADTNMTLAGQLPQGQAFLVTGMEVPFFSGASATPAIQVGQLEDINAIYKAGFLTLTIGTKPYTQDAPIGVFPQSFGVSGLTAVATTVAATTEVREVSRIVGSPYSLSAGPLLLTPSVNFNVQIGFATAVALPSGADGRFGVRLKGMLYRLAQ
jgi:hypothetical protein